MPLTLPDNVYLKYGGYTFRPESKTKLSITPTPDRAGRATKYVTYTFDVQTTIFADAPAQNTSSEMVNKIAEILQQHGNRLQFQGFGFDIDVNNPQTNLRDVTYGPHPRITDCVHLGQGHAWAVNWHCETSVTDMCSKAFKQGVLAYNFEWDVSTDNRGYSTRTITGAIEVAGYRATQAGPNNTTTISNGNLSDNADKGFLDYWDRIYQAIQPIEGFDRTHVSRRLSDDKRTLTFTVVDQEMPKTAFQKGMISWTGTHEANTSMQAGFFRAQNTISASYKVSRGANKSDATKLFMDLVRSRIMAGKPYWKVNSSSSSGGFFGSVNKAFSKPSFIPANFRATETLHDDEISFSYSWAVFCNIKDLLKACGFQAVLPNSGWSDWWKSLNSATNKAKSSRGNAQIYFKNEGDAIIDICSSKQPVLAATGNSNNVIGAVAGGAAAAAAKNFNDLAMPDPDNSWIAYESRVHVDIDSKQAFHKPLGNPGAYTGTPDLDLKKGFTTPFQQGNVPADIVQTPTASNNVFVLMGGAMRAGYQINPPELVAVGGVKPVVVKMFFHTFKVADYGIPVLAARWRAIYRLPSVPNKANVLPASSPVLPTAGTDGKTVK